MAKNKDKKLSKKERKAQEGAIPAMSNKAAKSVKKASRDAYLKKIKEDKQSNKVDSKAKKKEPSREEIKSAGKLRIAAANKKVADKKDKGKVNIFTAIGLDIKHRTVAFQLPRHFDEVTVTRNKEQFPYEAEFLLDSTFVAVLVLKGKVSFFSRTGNQFQNLEVMAEQFKVKADGVYMAEIFAPELESTKFNLLFSPFRTNKLTAPQQVTVDDKAMLVLTDYITVEEFATGKSEAPHSERVKTLGQLVKKLIKGKGSRFATPYRATCNSEEELRSMAALSVEKGNKGIAIRGAANPYVCGHQNFHHLHMLAPVKFNLKCVGFQAGAGKTEGQVANLIFSYKDGEIKAPLGHNYSEKDSIAMLKTLTSDGKDKKKKAKKGKKVKTASSPLGYVWEVNALEVNSKGVMKLPTVGQFTKAKADF